MEVLKEKQLGDFGLDVDPQTICLEIFQNEFFFSSENRLVSHLDNDILSVQKGWLVQHVKSQVGGAISFETNMGQPFVYDFFSFHDEL